MYICFFGLWKTRVKIIVILTITPRAVPHTWQLSGLSFITMLKLVWRDLGMVAIKIIEKRYLPVHRGHELETALYVLFTLPHSHALLKKPLFYSFTVVLTPQLSEPHALDFKHYCTRALSLLSFDNKVLFPTRHRALLDHGHFNHPSLFATRKRVRRSTSSSCSYLHYA